MSILNITIKGLALCRPVGSMTQILFPHAPDHTLELTVDNGIAKITEEFFQESFMTMTSTSGVTPVPPVQQDGSFPVNNLINLNLLHLGLPDIQLKNRHDVLIPVSYLSVPTSGLFSQQNSNRQYEIWVKRYGPTMLERRFLRPAPNAGTIDEDVRVSFDISATGTGGVPAMKLQVETPFNRLYTFEDTGRDYEITFDNHCHSEASRGRSDFGYYYEILEAVDPTVGIFHEIEEFQVSRPFDLQGDSEAACNAVMGDPKTDLGIWHRS